VDTWLADINTILSQVNWNRAIEWKTSIRRGHKTKLIGAIVNLKFQGGIRL
jgi:hypothetical protein